MTSKLSKKFIQIADLYLAYRKSKTEAFFDNLHPSALAYTEYEKNLEGNLKNLFLRVTASDASWPQDCSFIGGHIYVPKSLSESDWQQNEDDVHYRAINPIDDWQMRFEASGKKQLTARYRLVITASVDYQILSALWILKVGHKFEITLNKDVSFGNRLRRNRPNSFMKLWFQNGNGKLNQDCSGLFSPYFSGYQTSFPAHHSYRSYHERGCPCRA